MNSAKWTNGNVEVEVENKTTLMVFDRQFSYGKSQEASRVSAPVSDPFSARFETALLVQVQKAFKNTKLLKNTKSFENTKKMSLFFASHVSCLVTFQFKTKRPTVND